MEKGTHLIKSLQVRFAHGQAQGNISERKYSGPDKWNESSLFWRKKKRIEKNITGRNTVKLTEHYAKS